MCVTWVPSLLGYSLCLRILQAGTVRLSKLVHRLKHICTLYLGEGNGTALQYSCLENPMDGGAWWAAVHGVAKSWTRLSDFPFTFHFHALEKEMATYSSVLAWRIPGTGEPGGLPSVGLHRVGHDWSDLAAAAAVHIYFALIYIFLYIYIRICLQCRRPLFDTWVRKIFWMRAWQPTLVLLPRESHEQRILEGCGPYGHTESDTTEATKRRQQQQQQHLLPESTSMTKWKDRFSHCLLLLSPISSYL